MVFPAPSQQACAVGAFILFRNEETESQVEKSPKCPRAPPWNSVLAPGRAQTPNRQTTQYTMAGGWMDGWMDEGWKDTQINAGWMDE